MIVNDLERQGTVRLGERRLGQTVGRLPVLRAGITLNANSPHRDK